MKKVDAARPVFMRVGPALFKAVGQGKRELCRSFLANCEAVGCRLPAAQIGQSVTTLRELVPDKAVFAWIETKCVSPGDIRASVRSTIAAGATGIGYRGFERLKGEKPEAAVVRPSSASCRPWAAVSSA